MFQCTEVVILFGQALEDVLHSTRSAAPLAYWGGEIVEVRGVDQKGEDASHAQSTPKGDTTMVPLRACRIDLVMVSERGEAILGPFGPLLQLGTGTCANSMEAAGQGPRGGGWVGGCHRPVLRVGGRSPAQTDYSI